MEPIKGLTFGQAIERISVYDDSWSSKSEDFSRVVMRIRNDSGHLLTIYLVPTQLIEKSSNLP